MYHVIERMKVYIEKILNERFGIYYKKAPVRVQNEGRPERFYR